MMEKKLLVPGQTKTTLGKTSGSIDPKNQVQQINSKKVDTKPGDKTLKKGADPKNEKLMVKSRPSEEILAEVAIFPIEKTHLDRVFTILCGKPPSKEAFITAEDIQIVLTKLDYNMHRSEIELMIWEVDDNLDGKISYEEYILMYKRCIKDETGLEPKNFFNLVQFLMFDRRGKWKITEEDTYDLIYVREVSLEALDAAIKDIFGYEKNQLLKYF